MAPLVLVALAALLVIPLGIVAILYLVVPLFKAIGWLVRQAGRFIVGEVADALRIVGAVVTQVVLLPIVILNILVGRWSAAGHYGRAFSAEFKTAVTCVYRMVVGHPARLLCLTALTDGLEKRLPAVMAAAPTSDTPSRRTVGQFEGYKIVGSLPGGGSGGKLYVAEPDAVKLASFARNGQPDVRQVVIKTFSLKDGSSLPQIVRESRALEAAKRLGLVLEHELSDERFYYVTQYVPGESLALVTQRLHAMSDHSLGDGLDEPHLRQAMGYSADLLRTLDQYHRGGLWHKDVKPDNIIVDSRSAHLVDFGLVTPLRSGMTLTTHGTEYFRDPEMVRLALKGVKVHQVDGARFDVYAAGACLFSMIENSFPAHGGLSQITKRCPEALRWIVRRSMTDYDKRYAGASAMLADLEAVRLARDPFAVKPFELPSMRGAEAPAAVIDDEAPIRPAVAAAPVGAGSDAPANAAGGGWVKGFNVGQAGPFIGVAARIGRGAGSPNPGAGAGAGAGAGGFGAGGRQRPRIRVNRWWTGGYVVEDAMNVARDAVRQAQDAINGAFGGFTPPMPPGMDRAAWSPRNPGMSAQEQVKNARARVQAARERARSRMAGRRKAAAGDFRPLNAGVAIAVLLFLGACVAFAALMVSMGSRRTHLVTSYSDDGTPGVAFATVDLDGIGGLVADMKDQTRSAVDEMRASAENAKNAARAAHPGRRPRVQVNGRTVAPDAPPTAVMQSMDGVKALVVSDVVPFPDAAQKTVDRLKAAGFQVLGNYPGNKAEESDIQEQLDLEANVKQLRGLSPLTADDLRQSLCRWVGEEDLGLLVWFSREDPSKPAVQAHLFAAAAGAGEPESEQARAALSAGIRAVEGEVSR